MPMMAIASSASALDPAETGPPASAPVSSESRNAVSAAEFG